MSHNVLVFSGDRSSPFTDAITLGQGLPVEKDGKPVRYFWKEALKLGRYQDKHGQPFEITGQRIDNLIGNFRRAKESGFLPCVPSRHEKDGATNFGYVVDARKNDGGGLELMCQMIGDDAILAAARNGASICTVADASDDKGNRYDELIDHLAVVPDPQLSNLQDFKPALAASRGATASAVVLSLAASEESKPMDLTPLRNAIGADPKLPDADVLSQAIAKLTEGKTALELSRTKATEADAFKTRAEQAEAKLLELSKGEPDPTTLEDRRITAEEVLCGLVERGQCTDGMAKIVRENFIGAEKQPSLMLSRGARSGPVGAVFKLLELNKELKGFRQTDGQPVGRHVPGSDNGDAFTEGRAEGEAARKAQLAARGIA
jgi:hypothetical protein